MQKYAVWPPNVYIWKLIQMLRFCLLALFVVLFLSCLSEPECVVTASGNVKISLTKPTSDTAFFVKFDRIVVSGTDSLFHVGDSVSTVILPVQPGNYQTTFHFFYDSKQDSMTISYTRSARVISPACGAFLYFQDLTVVMHSFSFVDVLNAQLSTGNAPNLTVKL
jgi:Family of unknown function (DUF6452)